MEKIGSIRIGKPESNFGRKIMNINIGSLSIYFELKN